VACGPCIIRQRRLSLWPRVLHPFYCRRIRVFRQQNTAVYRTPLCHRFRRYHYQCFSCSLVQSPGSCGHSLHFALSYWLRNFLYRQDHRGPLRITLLSDYGGVYHSTLSDYLAGEQHCCAHLTSDRGSYWVYVDECWWYCEYVALPQKFGPEL
jgi:hypothetical protein